ncbi:Hypothetical predicted protein, partial [Paramuricea clavata]
MRGLQTPQVPMNMMQQSQAPMYMQMMQQGPQAPMYMQMMQQGVPRVPMYMQMMQQGVQVPMQQQQEQMYMQMLQQAQYQLPIQQQQEQMQMLQQGQALMQQPTQIRPNLMNQKKSQQTDRLLLKNPEKPLQELNKLHLKVEMEKQMYKEIESRVRIRTTTKDLIIKHLKSKLDNSHKDKSDMRENRRKYRIKNWQTKLKSLSG